jgi:hypothetical protein
MNFCTLLSAGFRWPESPIREDLRAQIGALDDDEVRKRIAIMRTHQANRQPEQARARKPAPPKPTTNAGKPPKPDPANIVDAIQHADHEQQGWTRKDFTIHYKGYLSVDRSSSSRHPMKMAATRRSVMAGRVNFANAHNLRLHVWHIVHKRCRNR